MNTPTPAALRVAHDKLSDARDLLGNASALLRDAQLSDFSSRARALADAVERLRADLAPRPAPLPASPVVSSPVASAPAVAPARGVVTLADGHPASRFQRRIFAHVERETGDGIVGAVAGSGKTSTLVSCASRIRGEGLFLAFNKAIAEELGARLSATRVSAKTIHAVGYGALRNALHNVGRPDDAKYKKLADEFVKTYRVEFEDDLAGAKTRLRKLCHFARLTLTPHADPVALEAMAARYNLDFADGDGARVHTLITRGDQMADAGVIDFTDMLWLPVSRRLRLPQVDYVMVDECQDLSACQLALVRALRAPSGRMLFVGDEFQAIQGFAGADSHSYQTIRDALGAREMPLSICYRCPASHVALAQTLVPQIEARPGAPEGTVETVGEDKLVELAREGDMIISRRNAPLIKHCLRLINARKPARIKGRDVGKELAEMIRQVGKLAGSYARFPDAIEQWAAKGRAQLDARDASEAAYELLEDKAEALHTCYAGFPARDADELASSIESLFADERASIWLSSVHRSKGLEADRVFIVEPERLGQRHPKASDDEYQQELNLKYVSLTRSREALYFLH